jgi:dihydrofolate reductase
MGSVRYRLNMAVTVDGFIAEEDGGVGFLDGCESPEMDLAGFFAQIGALVMGRLTYEQCLGFGWPYEGKRTVVVGSRGVADAAPDGVPAGVEFHRGSVAELMARFEREEPGDVWLVGGPRLVAGFLEAGARPAMELAIVPRLLGRGVPLFLPGAWRGALRLVGSKAHANGVVVLKYEPGE